VTATTASRADAYAGIDAFDDWGIRALVTTRDAGSFSTAGDEPVAAVLGRWDALRAHLFGDADRGRLATARQVHGAHVLVHDGEWEGWLRGPAADGHLAPQRGTALAVSVADCVPVFVAHPSGAVALLHSGWRGTEASILAAAMRLAEARGLRAAEMRVVLGPAICGRCYEVSADVRSRLTGEPANRPGHVDIRSLIAEDAHVAGVREVSVSPYCTRCDNEKFYSHRAGDTGRQIAVIVAPR
jgi:YfiH family protein